MKVKRKIYDLQIAAFHVVGQDIMAQSFGLDGLVYLWKAKDPGPRNRTWHASFRYNTRFITRMGHRTHRMICLAGWLAEITFRDALTNTEINGWIADPSDLAQDLADALASNNFSASETEGLQGWKPEELVEVLRIQKKHWSVVEAEAKEWIAWALADPVTA